MKKIIKTMLLISLLSSCSLFKKEDGIILKIDPTCTRDGIVKYYEDGVLKEEVLSATGHDYVETNREGECNNIIITYTCSKCNKTKTETTSENHEVTDDGNYITFKSCKKCNHLQRLTPTNEFLEDLIYTYTSSDLKEIEDIYNSGIEIIDNAIKNNDSSDKTAESIIDKINTFDEKMESILNNYHVAEINYYKTNSNSAINQYNEIEKAYNTSMSYYGHLLNKAFNSLLKEKVFEGEDLEEIEEFVAPYTDTSISVLENEISELEYSAYYEHSSQSYIANDFSKLAQLRNNYAAKFGYDNFYDYSFKETYSRQYDNYNIVNFRKNVLKYGSNLLNKSYSNYSKYATKNAIKNINFINDDKNFNNSIAMDLLSNYLKTNKSEKYNLDQFDLINKAFKEGRIFIGDKNGLEAAFTQSTLNGPYMYFADATYYSSLNTMVHEMGHYTFEFFSDSNYNDFDLLETHSQSNEFLFLKYLNDINYYDANSLKALEYYKAYSTFETVLVQTIIDEYEEAIYKNYSDIAEKYKNGISGNEYISLLTDLNNKYNASVSMDYLKYYFINSPVYGISYAVSVIPCLTLYIDSNTNLENAKESYYKILTFLNNEEYKGDKSYLDVLNYANYHNPFIDSTFDLINQKYGK